VKQAYLIGNSLEAIELARRLGWEILAMIDPRLKTARMHGLQVINEESQFIANPQKERRLILAIDACLARRRVFLRYVSAGFEPITLCGVRLSESTQIGLGSYIQDNSNISVNCVLGCGVRVNCLGNVMHDCVVGDFTTVAPNAVLLGGVTVEKECYIGAGAIILPKCLIGRGAVVGAGAVVTSNVAAGMVVKGVPAR
jgi:UDP-N-acetylbacillosamine N-acetyltransferase